MLHAYFFVLSYHNLEATVISAEFLSMDASETTTSQLSQSLVGRITTRWYLRFGDVEVEEEGVEEMGWCERGETSRATLPQRGSSGLCSIGNTVDDEGS